MPQGVGAKVEDSRTSPLATHPDPGGAACPGRRCDLDTAQLSFRIKARRHRRGVYAGSNGINDSYAGRASVAHVLLSGKADEGSHSSGGTLRWSFGTFCRLAAWFGGSHAVGGRNARLRGRAGLATEAPHVRRLCDPFSSFPSPEVGPTGGLSRHERQTFPRRKGSGFPSWTLLRLFSWRFASVVGRLASRCRAGRRVSDLRMESIRHGRSRMPPRHHEGSPASAPG